MVRGIHSPFPQATQTAGQPAQTRTPNPARPGQSGFDELLRRKMQDGGVRFSRHAVDRMESRNIRIGPADMEKINGAVNRAAEKGVKDSLLVLDQHAFIVSVENRTVITAMDKEALRDNLVTNIDSAIVL